jgi:predicted dehydrogenase
MSEFRADRNAAVPNRRTFLKTSAAAVAATAFVGSLNAPAAHAAGSDVLKVALIGCGGRGSGAAVNAMNAEPNVRLTVLADAFPDQIEEAKKNLSKTIGGEKYAVTDEMCFVGFDAYKQALATDVDVVILTTPPHFRPQHLQAAIEAGKHVFCEKPVAVDAPGVRSVMATAAKAKEKNLSIVSGLCWRYDLGVRDTIKQIQDGAIGDITAIQENYLTGTLWHRGRRPEWSDMEFQMRNWLYFTWLSGDHNVEQHIHSLDKAMWLMGDKPPARCYGMGGRQVRTGEEFGNIFDHHAVVYEWDNGVKCFAFTRQMKGCSGDVDDYVFGTKGNATILKNIVKSGDQTWRYKGEKPSMYDVEHKELFAGIRSGSIINNGDYMSSSTMLAIMGRMATYTGQTITWEDALNSKEDLTPAAYAWGPVQLPHATTTGVAVPGVTPFV